MLSMRSSAILVVNKNRYGRETKGTNNVRVIYRQKEHNLRDDPYTGMRVFLGPKHGAGYPRTRHKLNWVSYR